MPINEKFLLGRKHEITLVAFGTGDIKMSKAKTPDIEGVQLLFHEQEPRKIGSLSDEWVGKDTDELPRPPVMFSFTKPESIAALIHSLIELQSQLFE